MKQQRLNMKVLLLLHCFFVIFNLCTSSPPPHCGLYGAPPCSFVPAPPGMTPSCAGPGRTYCESISQYPLYIIKQLISKWGYDFKSLLADETGEEFESIRHRLKPQSHFVGPYYPPPSAYVPEDEGYKYPNPNSGGYSYNIPIQGFPGDYPEPIYIPTPPLEHRYQDYNQASKGYYRTSSQNSYQNNQNSRKDQNVDVYIEQQQVTEYNSANLLRRLARNLRQKRYANNLRETSKKLTDPMEAIDEKVNILSNSQSDTNVTYTGSRKKRQSPGRETLCQVNSQFITPQAALNSRGNWMYVINQVDQARQLVKTETCASSICSNLCQIPNGYNSRCEQKYVQKRLIALNSNGQNLYTDTFWFPSCCVCTISNQ